MQKNEIRWTQEQTKKIKFVHVCLCHGADTECVHNKNNEYQRIHYRINKMKTRTYVLLRKTI